MAHKRGRHVRRGLMLGGGSLAGMLLGWTGTGPVAAQSGYVQELPSASETFSAQRLYFNKNVIHLPIQITDQYRAQVKEVQLYMKENLTAPWALRDTVGPDQKSFSFHAQHDGEYAFTMVTVDKSGRRIPADVNKEPPGLVIVIDTKLPQVDLTFLGKEAAGQMVQFVARDGNLDSAKVRFFFQGGDKQFRQIEALANRPAVYCIPEQAVFTGIVRASAADLAGNVTTREFHISQLPSISSPTASKTVVHEASPPAPLPSPTASADSAPPNPLPFSVTGPAAVAVDPEPIRPSTLPELLPTPTTSASHGSGRPDGSEGPRFSDDTVSHSVNKVAQTTATITLPAPEPSAGHKDTVKRQLVNQNKVFLDYQIENARQNGTSKVEVWVTRDQGKNWTKHAEDTRCQSPIGVHLPEDGLYGLSLVVSSHGKSVAPAGGDTPDWLIEVDTTKPVAQITHMQTLQENGTTVVLIGWNAQDANLAEYPVELFYSATAQGPWLPIAKELTSKGQHRWTPPDTISGHAFVRVVARDKAGNTAVACTMDPIHLEEAVRPRAFIRGVHTESGSASEPR